MNTKDKNLLESLIQKYGASNVNSAINKLNELNSKTYMNAAIEARKRNQLNRTVRLRKSGLKLNQEMIICEQKTENKFALS